MEEKIVELNGYKLHLIKTNKFKDISISVRYKGNLTEHSAACKSLLANVLLAGTKSHPTSKDIARYCEELYGLKIGAGVSSFGKAIILRIASICVNEEFLPLKDDVIVKQIKLINEVINNPLIENEMFKQSYFDLKQKDYIDNLITMYDDKFTYSLDKLFTNMGKGQALGIASNSTVDNIKAITNEMLFEEYKQILKNDEKDVFVVGDFNDSIIDIFRDNLTLIKTNNNYDSYYSFRSERKEVLEIIEKQDITQAKMVLGYKTDICIEDDDYFSLKLLNDIFGGNSQSRLFLNIREKNSMCYFINSFYDSFNGILGVLAGINDEDYHKVKEMVKEELNDLKQGNISDDEIALSKNNLINNFLKGFDNPAGIMSNYYSEELSGTPIMEKSIELINNVSREDLIRVASKLELDTIYLLSGGDING